MNEMAKKYGPVFQVNFQGQPAVVVCDFPGIYEVLITKSADFAGRPTSYMWNISTEGQSGIIFSDAGPKLQGRRKLMHTYLKQYGAGMTRIEEVTMDATSDMIQNLLKKNGEPVNIKAILLRCVSDIIAIMLTGEAFSDEIIEETKHVVYGSSNVVQASLSGVLLNNFPFVRHFGNHAYRCIIERRNKIRSLIEKWIATEPNNGFINFVMNLSKEEKQKYHVTEFKEQRLVIFNLEVAGVLTTSTTLAVLMNVLCQRPELQDKLRQEIRDVIGESRPPYLADRENMPYHMATLLEIGRYASILPLGLQHKTTRDTAIESSGRKIPIPAGIEVLTNLWSMHHNEELFPEPFHFDPCRFLDSDGKLVEADHPNRKHLMPFGAGHRVCVGEVFAMGRMFLILSCLVQNFHILPESTLDKQPSHDPRYLKHFSVSQPMDFKVRLNAL